MYNIAKIDHSYFSAKNIAEHPHRLVIVGFIAADGCISDTSGGQRRLHFNICRKDRIALEIINNEVASGSRKIYSHKAGDSISWYVPSDAICDDLKAYGITPRKTQTLILPDLPELGMSYFLRGFFYGDGCVSGEGSRRVYHMVTSPVFGPKLRDYLIEQRVVDRCGYYSVKNKNASRWS